MRICLLICLVLPAGCGSSTGQSGDNGKAEEGVQDNAPADDGGDGAEASRTSFHVAEPSDLPACEADSEGWLAYVGSEKKFMACLDGDWSDVTPSAGASTLVAKTLFCPMTGDIDPDPDVSVTGISAFITVFTTGEYMISCMVSYADSAYFDSDSSSQVAFWPASSKAVVCVAKYATVAYDPKAKTATWALNSGDGDTGKVSCE